MRSLVLSFVACGAAALAAPEAVRADDAALLQKVEKLEARVQELESGKERERDAEVSALEDRVHELETSRSGSSSGAADWTRRVRLSGSANFGYYDGARNSGFDPGSFKVWDARLFVDADLGRDVFVGETKLLRDVGFSFEWNAVRRGRWQDGDSIGEAYVDLQGIADQDWLNLQVGRFQIPVGEAYLRYSRGTSTNPFISQPVGGPWWWDEGLRAYGRFADGLLQYVASISNGETPFNDQVHGANQLTLKLITEPTPWLHLSVSGLRSGGLGNKGESANSALWLGETWATPVGSLSWLPVFQDGRRVMTPAPNQFADTYYLGADAILHFEDAMRLWLSYGRYDLSALHASSFDRQLQQWIAELVLEGALVGPTMRPFYLALRANGLGTYDRDEGYVLNIGDAWSIGYNARSLNEYSVGLGWRITPWATLRAEYQIRDVELVRGVPAWIRDAAKNNDAFGVELGASF